MLPDSDEVNLSTAELHILTELDRFVLKRKKKKFIKFDLISKQIYFYFDISFQQSSIWIFTFKQCGTSKEKRRCD